MKAAPTENQIAMFDNLPTHTGDVKTLRLVKDLERTTVVPSRYTFVQNDNELADMADLVKRAGIMAIDCETTGLLWKDRSVAIAVTSGWAPDKLRSWLIPTDMVYASRNFTKQEVFDALDSLLADPNIKKINHNIKFDMHKVRRTYGLETWANVYHDTLIAQWLLNENESHDLETICETWLDAPKWKIKNDGKFGLWPTNVATNYACGDTENVFLLYEFQARHLLELPDLHKLLYEVEMPHMLELHAAEREGVAWDADYAVKVMAPEIDAALTQAEADCRKWLGNINIGSAPQLQAIIFDGLGLPPTVDDNGNESRSLSKQVLARLRYAHPVIEALERWRKFSKAKSGFVTTLSEHVENGRIHPTFSPIGARTGRCACIAKGSFVDAPRNLLKYPKGIPIEDIQPGQYVYSFDEKGVPRPKRVIAVLPQGRKNVLRLVWRASGSKSYLGELKATADHRIRLFDGTYKRMDELQPEDKLAFLSRSVSGLKDQYATLSWGNGQVPEHCHLVPGAEIVHHRNHIKLDNSFDNLEALTKSEHTKHHAVGKIMPTKDCPYTRDELADLVSNGIVAAIKMGHDHKTLKRWAAEYQVVIPNRNTVPICTVSDELLLETKTTRTILPLSKKLGVSYYRALKWCEEAGLRQHPTNHRVVAVIDEGEETETFDLAIEDTPNFVVNEIGVHNCKDPNLQNLPKQSLGPVIRRAFVPSPGYVLVSMDYSQIELRLLAHFSQDEALLDVFRNDRDIHHETMTRMFGALLEGATPEQLAALRVRSKTCSFGVLYGMGIGKLCDTINFVAKREEDKITRIDAQGIQDGYFESYPGVAMYIIQQARVARKFGYVRTILGRKRRLPNIRNADRRKSASAERQATNAPIQGSAADLIKVATVAVTKACRVNHWPYRLLLQIHDELIFEVPLEWLNANRHTLALIADIYANAVPLSVPVKVSQEILSRWGDKLVEDDLDIIEEEGEVA